MNEEYYHSLPLYLKLFPFFIAISLLIHVIVLSFLLTLPVYSKHNEKKSLRGHYVYLISEKTNKTQSSTGRNMSEKQIAAAKNIETAINPEKIIAAVKNKEELASAAGPVEEMANSDIKIENITGEGPSIIKQNKIYTDGKLTDIKPLYTGPEKEDEIIGKETDKIEKPETATPVSAVEHSAQTEAAPLRQQKDYLETSKTFEVILSGTDHMQKEKAIPSSTERARMDIKRPVIVLRPSFGKDISGTTINLPEKNSQITLPLSAKIMEKAATIEKGKAKIDEPLMPDHTLSVNNAVRDDKKAVYMADKREKALSEKIADSTGDKKTMPIITAKKPAEKAKLKKSPVYEIPSPLSRIQEAVSVQKNEKRTEVSKAIVNSEPPEKTIQAERFVQNHIQEDLGKKFLSATKEKVPILAEIQNIIKKSLLESQPGYKKTPGLNIKAKVSVKSPALAAGAFESNNRTDKVEIETSDGIGTEKEKNAAAEMNKQVKKDTEAKVERSSTQKMQLLWGHVNKNPKSFLDRNLATDNFNTPVIKRSTYMNHILFTKVAQIKIFIHTSPLLFYLNAFFGSIGLPMDGSLFYKDIKIEVLQKKAVNSGIYMYLLKNTYLSLSKRHTWGKEKIVEMNVETKKKNDTEEEIKSVLSVAKTDKGIYTFVIENKNPAPYYTELLFTLYERQKPERIKKIKAVRVPPFAMVRIMFVLPDTIFWDDEEFFTGSIEDSDSITKFNDKTGFVWREEKDN